MEVLMRKILHRELFSIALFDYQRISSKHSSGRNWWSPMLMFFGPYDTASCWCSEDMTGSRRSFSSISLIVTLTDIVTKLPTRTVHDDWMVICVPLLAEPENPTNFIKNIMWAAKAGPLSFGSLIVTVCPLVMQYSYGRSPSYRWFTY